MKMHRGMACVAWDCIVFGSILGAPMPACGRIKTPPAFAIVNCCDANGLTVFPLKGESFTVPLPFVPSVIAFGPSGDALYALKRNGHDASRLSLVKVQFHPTRVSSLLETIPLDIANFTVSRREDKALVVGRRASRGKWSCGIFEVAIPSGVVRAVLENSDCRHGVLWQRVKLSPGGDRVLDEVGRDIQVIDLAGGGAKNLSREFAKGPWSEYASWSPDGKWIAVLESGRRGRVILLDATDLSRRRTLAGGSHGMPPVWSPDSKYILRGQIELRCGISFDVDPPYTLEVLDIESGTHTKIRSSRCRMERGETGWLKRQF